MSEKRFRTGKGVHRGDYFSETIIDEATGEKYYGGVKANYVSSSEIVKLLNEFWDLIQILRKANNEKDKGFQVWEAPPIPAGIRLTTSTHLNNNQSKKKFYHKDSDDWQIFEDGEHLAYAHSGFQAGKIIDKLNSQEERILFLEKENERIVQSARDYVLERTEELTKILSELDNNRTVPKPLIYNKDIKGDD